MAEKRPIGTRFPLLPVIATVLPPPPTPLAPRDRRIQAPVGGESRGLDGLSYLASWHHRSRPGMKCPGYVNAPDESGYRRRDCWLSRIDPAAADVARTLHVRAGPRAP